MAKDFDISPLSGIGPATITVKPKSVNDSESIRDQVIKVVVQGDYFSTKGCSAFCRNLEEFSSYRTNEFRSIYWF